LAWTPRILIVDDEPGFNQSLKISLSEKKYEILQARCGLEACGLISRQRFDLVLLDLVLPDMSGLEVMERIKRHSPRIKIIAMTGFSSTESAIQCLRGGAYDYLRKPFELEEMQQRVGNALEQMRLEKEKELISHELTESESRYQYLVQNSPDIIYTLDPRGAFTFLSGSAQSILNLSLDSLLGKDYSVILHPEDVEKAVHTFNERRTASRNGKNLELRLTTILPEQFVLVELRAKGLYDLPPQDPHKSFLGTYGVLRDITKNKQTEEELNLQRAYFQQLFENSPEGIAILDNSDRIISVNKGFEKLFQFSIEEIKGRRINDLIVPQELMDEANNLSQVTQSMGIVQKETSRRRKDGSRVEVSILGYPILHHQEQVGIFGIYSDIAQHKRWESQLQKTLEKLRKAMGATIHAIASTVEARDPYTAGHQQRVANLARAIGQEMGLSLEIIDGIRMAGAIHDLGKINVPAEILSKPGRITDIEFSLIKTHPKTAYDILKEIEFPWPVAAIVFQHHEKLDGSGYPLGLKGAQIMLEGRILTVADVVEAIASHRPYRPALGIDRALSEISEKRGSLYDPSVVDACKKLFQENRFSFELDASG